VRGTASGRKSLHHPKLSLLQFEYTSFQANDDPALKLVIYTPVKAAHSRTRRRCGPTLVTLPLREARRRDDAQSAVASDGIASQALARCLSMIVAQTGRVCHQGRRPFRGNLLRGDRPRDIGRVLVGKKLENGERPSTRDANTVAIATIRNCSCLQSRRCELGDIATKDATHSATCATRVKNHVAMWLVGGRPRFIHLIGKPGFPIVGNACNCRVLVNRRNARNDALTSLTLRAWVRPESSSAETPTLAWAQKRMGFNNEKASPRIDGADCGCRIGARLRSRSCG
jgi:hypothetical protein